MSDNFVLKYDSEKWLGEQTSNIFRSNYPIHIILKPKNNGATYWLWKQKIPSVVNSGRKFLFIRNTLKQCENFNVKDYQPNWKFVKYNQTIVEEFIDDNGKKIVKEIGAYEGFTTINNLQSRGDFSQYDTFWDEFIDIEEKAVSLDDRVFEKFTHFISNSCRSNPNYQLYMIGNRFVGDNDILNPLGVYFEDKNVLQEILVQDPDDPTINLVQAIYIPMAKKSQKTKNIANSIAKFNSSTNMFYNSGAWIHKRSNLVWSWRVISQFKWEVKFSFKLSVSNDDKREYYFIKFYLPNAKQTLYYIKKAEIGDNIYWDKEPLALDIGVFDDNTVQLDEEDSYDVWEQFFNYKRRRLLRFDTTATMNIIDRGISSYVSLDKSY